MLNIVKNGVFILKAKSIIQIGMTLEVFISVEI